VTADATADPATVLPPPLASALRCPACLEGTWVERWPERAGELASIECGGCGARYLVVEEIPLLEPLQRDATASEQDPHVERILRSALARYFDLFRGLQGVLAFVNEQPLEAAFRVPGAAWVTLSHIDSSWKRTVADLVGKAETVVDLGCGYGASTAPFLETAERTIGIDENLFLLLLFRRYARERGRGAPALICHDLGRARLPLADSVADVVIGFSFFNHFACLRGRGVFERFFAEAARVVRPGGGLWLGEVPNPRYPFLWEINFGPYSGGVLHRLLERPLRRLPLRRVPGPALGVPLWLGHSLYRIASRRRPLGYPIFRRELGKALPEIGSRVLPADVDGYRRIAPAFAQVELADEKATYAAGALVPLTGGVGEGSYVLLRCIR
jgi:SAM-dependent methyltransferase